MARAQLGPRDVDALPATRPQLTARYGSDALQFGELRLPPGNGPFPVAVVVHGGCWTSGLATLRNTAPMASELARHGIATWDIEYRQTGDPGGGWPGTFTDWASATDYLRVLARSQPLDLARVFTIGHSAGGHAALWIASRTRLATTSPIRGHDPLPVRGAIDIDGPPDFTAFAPPIDAMRCGAPVIVSLMGGTIGQVPERYRDADPATRLPLGVPQAIIDARFLTVSEAHGYAAKATAAGDRVSVLDVEHSGHFELIAPGTEPWKTVEPFILDFVKARR